MIMQRVTDRGPPFWLDKNTTAPYNYSIHHNHRESKKNEDLHKLLHESQ